MNMNMSIRLALMCRSGEITSGVMLLIRNIKSMTDLFGI